MLSETSRLLPSVNCTWKELSGSVIILQSDARPPVTHELNTTSSFIWNLLNNGKNQFSELLEALIDEFEVNPELAQKDLELLLTELINKNLLCIKN